MYKKIYKLCLDKSLSFYFSGTVKTGKINTKWQTKYTQYYIHHCHRDDRVAIWPTKLSNPYNKRFPDEVLLWLNTHEV